MLLENHLSYFEKTFSQLVLQEQRLEKIIFENCHFIECDFSLSKFMACKFIDCEFLRCNLSSISIENCRFSEVTFSNSKIIGVNWTAATWPHISLTSPIHFYRCQLSHSSFFELVLTEIQIESCKAQNVDFRGADLSHAHLMETDFRNSLFLHTKLIHADFTGAFHYHIDIALNFLQKAKFSFPEVIGLLTPLDIEIVGLDNSGEF